MRTRMQKLRVALLAASTVGAAVLFYSSGPAQADVTATSTGYVFTQTVGPNQAAPVSYNTDNTSVVGTKADGNAGITGDHFFWLINYDDSALSDPPNRCEKSDLAINNNP